VISFQKFNSNTALSLSLLNSAQQIILYSTLLGALVVAGRAVTRGDMTLGSWVAVNMWVNQIFMPLNFLGTVYSMIVQSLIDVRNLSELLSESPDIIDDPDAKDLIIVGTPAANAAVIKEKVDLTDGDGPQLEMQVLVGEANDKSAPYFGAKLEFRDVHFNYPGQPIEKGLQGVSFVVQPGTTTAIVGSTGAGKTTVSRLLFRFYDPRLGQVFVDNKDIKKFSQKSVRKLVGINLSFGCFFFVLLTT
jgi:ATP-binding cassette, subfamily B, heavy metal transporter